jgi:hypothetical protein
MAKHSSLFQMLLAHNAPAIHAHFHEIELTTEHFLLDWWLTLYAKSATLPLAFRIWDCFLIEGEVFLHLAAVGMLGIENGTKPFFLFFFLFFFFMEFFFCVVFRF